MVDNNETISSAELVKLVRQVAAEMPEFVYTDTGDDEEPQCFYYPTDGNPCGCIVGEALRRGGVTVMDDPTHPEATNSADWLACIQPFDPVQRDWLSRVQSEQDRGASWATAVQTADEVFQAILPETP